MRSAHIFYQDKLAGILIQDKGGYRFAYDPNYLNDSAAYPISLNLPLRAEPYESDSLFPFFDGLIPEGWYLEIVARTLKIDPNDRFGILLATASHTMGAVTVEAIS